MLISRVEDGGEEGRSAGDAHDYQTASELFDLMARNQSFDDVSETLSTRDLVILYENIDLGTKLMSNAEELKLTRRSNQHVETVVYHDDPDSDSSDISEIYGTDDLHNVFMINKERLDLLNNGPSLENTLCQKLGDLEIQASNLSLQYDRQFLFKDPYIKEQLKNLNQIDELGGAPVFPASLLDYICCKRLEDNYNFYMDNIIRYVKHTIEQLKRISNGDYLTDRAKEKWKEVGDAAREDSMKVLATSTSIPLQVERKINGLSSTWDDIIHSEVDIRSLSKILEKKIIVEVPKLICGSFKLFSKMCSDNVVISCKRGAEQEERAARVDVVLQLSRSDTGHVVSNISSIMIVQPTPPLAVECPKVLPLPCNPNEEEEIEHKEVERKRVKIVEIPDIREDTFESIAEEEEMYDDTPTTDDMDDDYNESKNGSVLESGDSSVALKDILDTRAIPDILRKEAPFNFLSPDDLSLSMHKMNMSSLPEEASEEINQASLNKKKSPTKVRIKSPYENKSHAIEEKKRKRLLEIREKREKKKQAVGENCKITKHRYGKGAAMPQPTSSVTKLSITNKSFYNSIYGQNMNMDKQSTKSRGRRVRKELSIDMMLEAEIESPQLTPDKNNRKYIDRSYYLDEAVTEMMYTEMKPSECSSAREMFSGPASAMSGDFSANINIISQIINLPDSGLKEEKQARDITSSRDGYEEDKGFGDSALEVNRAKIIPSPSILNVTAPVNSIKGDEDDNEDYRKAQPSIECRKSIDKLYDLMKIRKNEPVALKSSKSKLSANVNKMESGEGQCSPAQGSDSGTSLKHRLTSSNPSTFSFDKIHVDESSGTKNAIQKKADAQTNVVSKVIISSKQQTKNEFEKTRRDRRKFLNPKGDNPLKAISQLLHEFDSVQKTRQKSAPDAKPNKKPDSPGSRSAPRPAFPRRRSRYETLKEIKEKEVKDEVVEPKNVKVIIMKERRPKSNTLTEPLRIPHQQIPLEDKHIDRAKKKIADMLDAAKEAKGEAVRGPPKTYSRLNTLAQPKKSYVQAHSEEYQTKYGRTLMADRLQRLAAAPAARLRARRGADANSSVSVRPSPTQPLGASRARRSGSSSPVGKAPSDASCKQSHATDAPDTLKNKMVDVESYVKSHYGPASPSAMSNELLKARVPLVPHDLDLASSLSSAKSGSTEIGSKLHHIITSMMNSKPTMLAALPEARETSSKASHDKRSTSSVSLPRSPGPASSVISDYRADIFEDKDVKTAVQSFEAPVEQRLAGVESEKSLVKYEGASCSSSIELRKLEEALHTCMSVATFQKRLRIKNLTLTPKHSMHRVLVLESGDAGSIVLKSTLSKSLKMSYSRSDDDIRSLASLNTSRLNWNLAKIPMQVATVGYAFPEYNAASRAPTSSIKSLENIYNMNISANSTLAKDKQAHKIHQSSEDISNLEDTFIPQETVPLETQNADVISSTPWPTNMEQQVTTVSVATDAFVHAVEDITRNCTNVTDVNKHEELDIEGKRDNVDSTSSLDMLVGILNEIQKITTCHITNTEMYADEREALDIILREDIALKEPQKHCSQELVSISSLDRLRQLESSPSIYSLYLSNNDKDSMTNICMSGSKGVRPVSVDKEISVDFPMREVTNTFTDVPSKFFPLTITHSTNITNSLIGILSKPSSHAVISVQSCDALESIFPCEKKIIEISEEIRPKEPPMIEYPETPTIETKIAKCKDIVKKKKKIDVKKVPTEISFSDESKCCTISSNDPLMKMKRDILVTVYSMLVLTVFAALSFPEIMYHV